MRPDALRPAAVLAVVTLLVWTTRIRNIWTDDGLTTAGQVGRTALALAFTAFAAATLALWWSGRRRGAARPWAPTLVRAFAAWTVGVWAIRGVQIATAGHDVAFVVVHTFLAVGSVAVAVWADRVAHAETSRPSRGTLTASR